MGRKRTAFRYVHQPLILGSSLTPQSYQLGRAKRGAI
jgi:hypothetical protein